MKCGDHVILYKLIPIAEGIVNSDNKTVTTEEIFNNNNQAEVQVLEFNNREYLIITKIIK